MLTNRVALPRIAAVVIASAVIGVTGPAVASAAEPAAPHSLTAVSEESQVANLARAFSALERMPHALRDRAPTDPEVQAWVARNVPNPVTPGLRFNYFTCGVAIAEFAVEVGIPYSKLLRIAKEAGSIPKFARYVFDFVRKGTLPADASDELIDLLLKVSGVGKLSACL